jgi:hypothetical protein
MNAQHTMIFALGFAACFALLQVRWGVDFARAGACADNPPRPLCV